MRPFDTVVSILGLITFLVGIALLIFVANLAYNFFGVVADIKAIIDYADNNPLARLGVTTVRMLIQVSLLIVMTIAGSLIAGKGIQLYFSSIEKKELKE